MFIKIDTSPEREKELRRQLSHIQSQLDEINRVKQDRVTHEFNKMMSDFYSWRKEQIEKGRYFPPIAKL